MSAGKNFLCDVLFSFASCNIPSDFRFVVFGCISPLCVSLYICVVSHEHQTQTIWSRLNICCSLVVYAAHPKLLLSKEVFRLGVFHSVAYSTNSETLTTAVMCPTPLIVLSRDACRVLHQRRRVPSYQQTVFGGYRHGFGICLVHGSKAVALVVFSMSLYLTSNIVEKTIFLNSICMSFIGDTFT